jgi:hypothetical protein
LGDVDIAKLGGGFSTDIEVVCLRLPLVAVITIVAGSGLGGLFRDMVSVEVPEPPVMVFVEKLAVTPDGALAERPTVPLKPLIGETVTAVVVD